MGQLASLFTPTSIGVVGATDRGGSVGRAIMENLQAEYEGPIVPINPNRETVLGLSCYPSIDTAPAIELVIVAVPGPAAIDAIEQAGQAGVGAAIVITAGFGEVGTDGQTRETELTEAAAKYDLPVVGPNSLGVASTPAGMNATFGPAAPLSGSISFMSQSGAFVTAAIDWATAQGIGFRHVVSLGNKAVIDETDLIEYWGDDPGTEVIIGYLEGIERGRSFIQTAQSVTTETPIILIKAGRTEAGAKAAASHTGTIAGSDTTYTAGLRQAGIIRADTAEELFDYAQAIGNLPTPSTSTVAIVTNAGGPGVMATDALGTTSLARASLTDETVTTLQSVLPDGANVYNPVDIIGDADVTRFRRALTAVMSDPGVGAVVALAAPTAVLSYPELASTLKELRAAYETPIVGCLMGGETAMNAREQLSAAGIPNYFDPQRAIRSLTAVDTVRQLQTRTIDAPPELPDVDQERARAILTQVRDRSDARLGVEAMALLDAYGIPTPDSEIVSSPSGAVTAAKRIGGPVVMKIVSPDILHKSDIGGVEVGVPVDAVKETYKTLHSRARAYQPSATIHGVQVQAQVDLEEVTETIVGTKRDPQFGQVVLFGLGGVFVEVLEDTTLRVGPVSQQDAQGMIDEIQASPLLRGARGRPAADETAIVDAIVRVSRLVEDFPAIAELDINPLVAGPDGVQAIDVRLTVEEHLLEQ